MNSEMKVDKVLELYESLTYQIENEEHGEEKLLSKELSSHKLLKNTKLSLTECHVVACIGDNDTANGTFIAKTLNITKGGVSKAAAKLIQKKMIKSLRMQDNKKEVYYELTELGKQLHYAHSIMHERAKEHQRKVLAGYTDQELSVVAKFLKDIID